MSTELLAPTTEELLRKAGVRRREAPASATTQRVMAKLRPVPEPEPEPEPAPAPPRRGEPVGGNIAARSAIRIQEELRALRRRLHALENPPEPEPVEPEPDPRQQLAPGRHAMTPAEAEYLAGVFEAPHLRKRASAYRLTVEQLDYLTSWRRVVAADREAVVA